jgi:hypothetical protein
MIIRFQHEFSLPVDQLYSYFQTPADWTRLYGLAGDVKDLGSGWYAVPLKRFPFRGFWRGQGEVRFTENPAGVVVEGYEEISVRYLFFLSPLIERLFLERSFRSIWEIGWHRLRKREGAGSLFAASN